MDEKLGKVGLIGRFKPLHKGGALLLEAVCSVSDQVIIGVGSANRYDVRNPFTAQESAEMVDAYLHERFGNYRIQTVPDFGHLPQYRDGSRWKQEVRDSFGSLDHFVTGNNYVAELLSDMYDVIHPAQLIPAEQQFPLRATTVRYAMATKAPWESMVPQEVSWYIQTRGLDQRFRGEFGLETIARHAGTAYWADDSAAEEQQHVKGGEK
ncbi:MAG: hypothetical protein ACOCWQ_00740 [Nanoarchaeota archaeon]